MTHNPLIIIPARGGSKGIPHKNIAVLAGRPLIAYTIDVAMQVAPMSHIILSSDDETIIEVARTLGLEVGYVRPAELATDTAGSREVILDAMRYADDKSISYDCVVLLQPTSPLRTTEDVLNAISLYNNNIDMSVSVTESSANPYYDCFEPDCDGYLTVSKGDGLLTRRQDAPQVYQFNGAVYVINPDSIRRTPLGSFRRRIPSLMPAERSVDIDSPLDMIIAETLIKHGI